VDNAAATITNPMPYAAIHQLGGPIVRHPKNKSGDRLKIKTKKFGDVEVSWIVGAMPARPFFPIYPDGTLTDAADQLMTAAAQRELQKQLN
jgi:phage gpG-like protein